MIEISLDKRLDKTTFLNFFDSKPVGGVNFHNSIAKDHPDIGEKNYKGYINDYYESHEDKLDTALIETRRAVRNTQQKFFVAVREVFKENFSREKYQGALSIFNCNPRYLEKNTFQIYYKKDLPSRLETAYHEVLHFIFFNYNGRHLSDLVKGLDTNSGIYWDLSEVFNVVLLRTDPFREIIGKRAEAYPSHKKVLPGLGQIWDGDIRSFVERGLEMLRNSP